MEMTQEIVNGLLKDSIIGIIIFNNFYHDENSR